MRSFGRLRRMAPAETGHGAAGDARQADEQALRARLQDDPNNVEDFAHLAAIVRAHAAEHHVEDDPGRAADDAVWALAEELAHSGRAWYPLVELARLSIVDDREAAMRRLGTAAERDPSGAALVMGLQMLRESGHSGDALNLGVAYWRPHEHDIEAGRHVVQAAVDTGRLADARRHVRSLAGHPDTAAASRLARELERLVARAGANRTTDLTIDLRERDLRDRAAATGSLRVVESAGPAAPAAPATRGHAFWRRLLRSPRR